MVDVVLINPYFFNKTPGRRLWLFPPLGLGYLAAALKKEGITVSIIDGTFSDLNSVINKVKKENPGIVGITCNVVTKRNALRIADELGGGSLLVAGGPQPSIEPGVFSDKFDIIVVGEGEVTFLELVNAYLSDNNVHDIKGIAFRRNNELIFTGKRELMADLNEINFPSRELFDNFQYQDYWQKAFGYKCTPIMTTRGCPFACNFCSKPVFGNAYRERSPEDVVREIEGIINLGYSRIWFADDIFTLNKARTVEICKKILEKNIRVDWDCLCRIDSNDSGLLRWMEKAGCKRVFFGIESGSNRMLKLIGKKTSIREAGLAVRSAKKAGLETGGFFMLGYPGETTESLLRTIRFSNSLPLDYMSYSIAYPIPGTAFFEQIKGKLINDDWDFEGQNKLKFNSDISERKLRLAILKGNIRFKLKGKLGKFGSIFLLPFEYATDFILKNMR